MVHYICTVTLREDPNRAKTVSEGGKQNKTKKQPWDFYPNEKSSLLLGEGAAAIYNVRPSEVHKNDYSENRGK